MSDEAGEQMPVAAKASVRLVEPETSALPGNRRSDIEQWLDSYGVEWTFVPQGAMADIDDIRSLKNQARLVAIDEGTVERYEIGWRNGVVFPPLVTEVGSRNAKQKIISGNHRMVSALKVGITHVDRYEVRNAKPATIAAMCREANNSNGLPPSETERIVSAIFTHKSQGIPLQKAAALFQVPLGKVQREFNQSSSEERAQEMGLDMHGFMALSKDVRARLATLQPDEIFAGAAELAVRAGLKIAQVKELVVALNEARSFAKKSALLKAWERTLKDQIEGNLNGRKTNQSKRPMTRRQRFGMALGNIRTFGTDTDGLLDTYSTNELPDLIEDVRVVIENLEKLLASARART